MVQSWNSAAVSVVVQRVLFRPSLAKPNVVVRTIADVDWHKLDCLFSGQPSVERVVFDKDNTLTAPYANQAHPKVQESLKTCVERFGRENVAVFSNSAGTPDDPGGVNKIILERTLGLPVVVHKDKKPLGFEQVIEHFGTTGKAPLDARSILVVGDRLLTDTVFANLHGAKSMHCIQTLDTRGDNQVAKVVRRIENALLKIICSGIDENSKFPIRLL